MNQNFVSFQFIEAVVLAVAQFTCSRSMRLFHMHLHQ
eukprot:02379.XXX_22484_22594_1 [CDS] Oithona nana genome sequencing.